MDIKTRLINELPWAVAIMVIYLLVSLGLDLGRVANYQRLSPLIALGAASLSVFVRYLLRRTR